MIKLVALLFLVTNGVPASEPYHTMPNNKEFLSKDDCLAYLKTDEGKASTQFVESWAAGQGGKISVKFDCVPVAKGESI